MSLTFQAIDPVFRPAFAGLVTGVAPAAPLAPAEAAVIATGTDRFAMLVCRDQRLSDEQQIAFSANFGPLEQVTGDLVQEAERRFGMTVNDISNLDRENQVLARDDRRRRSGLGNRLWHSDSSFKPTPAKYAALTARVIPARGGDTGFADMRAATTYRMARSRQRSPSRCANTASCSRAPCLATTRSPMANPAVLPRRRNGWRGTIR
ncbi:MAG: TauD/TfdA dioxygenase family protein [Acetobacteraceae bacterium]